MSIQLAKVIQQSLGALATVAESIEKSVDSIIRTSGKISSSLEKRKIRKIADALASFYFTPVGIRKDLEIFINHPTSDNLEILEERLEENQRIIRKFEDLLYQNITSSLFSMPIENLDYLFGVKSQLHSTIYDSRYELENLSASQKEVFLNEIKMSFENFNQKLEQTINNICNIS